MDRKKGQTGSPGRQSPQQERDKRQGEQPGTGRQERERDEGDEE